jgi:GMP synthase-like glutamine amidotransferase
VPTALVLANRGDADPGLVGAVLTERGYRMTVLLREDAEDGWPDALPTDVIVVLGSEWSVYSETVQPPVQRERELLAEAVERDTPVLAVCFGAQLLATALGGDAARAPHTELGWMEVEPLRDSAIEPGPWFQFHSDTFTVPPGATLLARSTVGPQAFRAGSALAVQFHPEVTPEIVGRWATSDPEPVARAGTTTDELVERTAAEQHRVQAATRRLVGSFLGS